MVGSPSHNKSGSQVEHGTSSQRDLDRRFSQRGLEAMKGVDQLVLLFLGQGRHPLLLMPMNNQPKLVGDLPADIGELDEKHPPVGWVRPSPNISPPFQ